MLPANRVPMLALTSPAPVIFNAPATPTPPRTTRAPVVVLVLAVVPTTTTLLLTSPSRAVPCTVRPDKVPTLVMVGCAAVATAPYKGP